MDTFSGEPQKQGSALAWLLLTAVVVVAGVAVFAFDTQKETALGQARRMKDDLELAKKHVATADAERADLERQVAALTAQKAELERAKNDATLRADDLTQQLALAKAAPPAPAKGGKSARAKRGKHRSIVVVRGQ